MQPRRQSEGEEQGPSDERAELAPTLGLLDTTRIPELPPHLVVRGVLGQGGTAVVYDAFHTRLETRVAVKVLALSGPGSREARQRLVREAHICAGLDDRRFPRIYDVDTMADGTPFVVLEHIRGTTLSDLIAKGPLGFDAACTIASEMLSALTVIHDVGILHRDVKPANVILQQGSDGSPRVRLVDFGIAKLMGIAEDAKGALTRHGELVGTPHYMSPEQLTGRALDVRADLYAVGVVLYEMLTGRVPFDGPTVSEVIASVLRDPLEPLRSSRPDCPPEIDELLRTALAREPEERFESAEAMRAQLERIRTATRSRLRLRVADLEGRPVTRKWPGRVVLGALVLLASWSTWMLLRPRDERERFEHARSEKPQGASPETASTTPAGGERPAAAMIPALGSAPVAPADAPTPTTEDDEDTSNIAASPEALEDAPEAPATGSTGFELELDLEQLKLDTQDVMSGSERSARRVRVRAKSRSEAVTRAVPQPAREIAPPASLEDVPLAEQLEPLEEALREPPVVEAQEPPVTAPPSEDAVGEGDAPPAAQVDTEEGSDDATPRQSAPDLVPPPPHTELSEPREVLPKNPYEES